MGSREMKDWTSLWVSIQPASPEKAAKLSPGAACTHPGMRALGRHEKAKGRHAMATAAGIRMAAGRRMLAPDGLRGRPTCVYIMRGHSLSPSTGGRLAGGGCEEAAAARPRKAGPRCAPQHRGAFSD